MLAAVAAVIFLIGYFINATSTSTDVGLTPISLLLAGLFFVALHLAGVGTGWAPTRRRRRR